MKYLAILLLSAGFVIASPASPDPRAVEINWASKDIEVSKTDSSVKLILHTGGIAGNRLIQARVESYADQVFTTLSYQIIQNIAECYRHTEKFDVVWTLSKQEFDKLRTERKFYILRRDDVMLTRGEIKQIY